MAQETSLVEIISGFETATLSAIEGLPSAETLLPPEHGITLFDTKNELFLSYLQALALRNLHIIRSIQEGSDAEGAQKLSDDITKRLIEQRVYLERGVKPIEQKLKYQVDSVVKAAEDADRRAAQNTGQAAIAKKDAADGTSGYESGEEDSGDDDSDSDSDEEHDEDMAGLKPNISAMQSSTKKSTNGERSTGTGETGVYRPPRISATAMPTTERREKKERRPGKSATLDEYIATELSAAPLAQPSIGSNLAAGGRQSKNPRQLREEAERREYEETNLVRLPAMSKKDRAKKGLGKAADGGFGGEEWRGFGDSLDRIGDLTRRKGKENALDRSRKRRAVEDGPRGDGVGRLFDQKKRRLLKKGQI